MSQRDFTCEASKSGALIRAGARWPQIFVDEDHMLFGPAQLASPVGKGVLTGSGFAVMLDLARRGLANVNVGGTLRVRGSDFREISHCWSAPVVCPRWL